VKQTTLDRSLSIFSKGVAQDLLFVGLFFIVFFALYFSPVWMHGNLLAPGDASISYFPFFHQSWTLISNQLLLGYPVEADLQVQANYLPKLLLPSYNIFVISAYVIMSLGTYAFVSHYVGSRLSAIFAAVITGSGGFMVAHLGHATIIHSACWIPWMLWAFYCCYGDTDGGVGVRWSAICVGAISVSLCLLGGHPQISIIGIGLTCAFWIFLCALAFFERRSWRSMAIAGSLIFALGLMLSAISIMPFAELAAQGVRTGWSLADFNTFSELPRTLLLGLFPGLFGTHPATFYGAYTGPWNLTELALYAGVGPLLLAAVAFFAGLRRPPVLFWAVAAIAALMVSMGSYTPLGRLVYHVPVLGSFRAQGRYGLIFIISIAVLAAFAVDGIRRGSILARHIMLGVAGFSVVLAAGLAYVARIYSALGSHPNDRAGNVFISMLHNPAVFLPCLLAILMMVVLFVWVRWRHTAIAVIAFILVIVDLGSFGIFYEWRFAGLTPETVAMSPTTLFQVREVRASGTRVLPVESSQVAYGPFSPQGNIRFQIPLAVNYGPLLPRRMEKFAALDTTGHPHFNLLTSPLPDILGVGWFSRTPGGPMFEESLLSRNCGVTTGTPFRAKFAAPSGAHGVRLRVISQMACSTEIGQGEPVADVHWSGQHASGVFQMHAGVDTSEWAFDRPGLVVKHQRAKIADSFDAPGAPGHDYVTNLQLANGDDVGINMISIDLADQGSYALRVRRIELVDAAGHVTPIPASHPGLNIDVSNPSVSLARRDAQPPLQWSVCAVRTLDENAMRETLASGAFTDGSRFDPHSVALLEQESHLVAPECTRPAQVDVKERRSGHFSAIVDGSGSSLLVISEAFYPGWHARIDGRDTSIIAVDGLVQGVLVPSGRHLVELRYLPKSFLVGLALTLLAIALLLVLRVYLRRRDPDHFSKRV
jgi:hypothetical protein